jgi:polyphenol oxidase
MPQLCPRTSSRLTAAGFRHGFFGRLGGHSRGNFASLNCSYSVGDEPRDVTLNLDRIANHFSLPAERLATVSQVHGCDVLDLDSIPPLAVPSSPRQADALISMRGKFALCIRTADCVPVLVGCRATGAAAAIHAGWRGIAAGIIPRTIEQLLARHAKLDALIVGIGPHIRAAAFEVSPEVASTLEASCPGSNAVDMTLGARPHVRLVQLVKAQLEKAGVDPGQVDDLEYCTFTDEAEYFSYRRDGRHSGRQISTICPLFGC